ncbi:glycoside hydrolase family 3 protein [Caviibacter abscessus]|uniref:glycoside hydrolase family 3 protein n=1 Tax=Caviibacter abscessus TaxID=1766719 RepID=UPI000836C7E5|nr:glycoside hydrolase family 3 N-terminal domain-containing protein [Caviibacter abscessus]
MPKLVDLTKNPYNLNESQIMWVENTIANMTDEEKIGQLFFNLFWLNDPKLNSTELTKDQIIQKYHIGGARYQGGTAKEVMELLNSLQEKSKIPLLIAANCDSGGNGACNDGTYIASAAQCEASGDTNVSYNTGLVSGIEETALGVNVNFDPCVDILKNWRNTIVNTRAYGRDTDVVVKHTNAYLQGLSQSEVIKCIKHFPGDGTEERDQHLVLGVNEMSVDEWENSFGRVYRNHINNGVEMIMAGHIALPNYQKQLVEGLEDKDILPATLAPELIQDLLKEKLGFNGLVITDASHMLGMTSAMRRKDYVPKSIASGCDMFLFFSDIDEDFNYMLDGYKNGVITKERLHDALRRILGLKAKLNLHEKQKNNTLLKTDEDLNVIGCEKHLKMQKEAIDKGISLIKNTKNELPIRPETHKRIRLYFVEGEKDGLYKPNEKFKQMCIDKLEKEGFVVTVNEAGVREKGSVEKYRSEVDAALVFVNVKGYAEQNNMRIKWSGPMSNEIPWYVHEVPTVMVSFNFTNHLHDATMVKCYINAYSDVEETINQVIDKIMGKSEFKGKYFNENVWAGQWQAKL